MKNMSFMLLALVTIITWGLYGNALHAGQIAMQDKEFGRWKAFFFVGIAYFVVAVIAPYIIIKVGGGTITSSTHKGAFISFLAGTLGAVGAFFVLAAFGAGIKQGIHPAVVAAVVMSFIFGFAPFVNAITAFVLHPPAGGVSAFSWKFFMGIAFLAIGGFMVAKFKPGPPLPAKPVAAVTTSSST